MSRAPLRSVHWLLLGVILFLAPMSEAASADAPAAPSAAAAAWQEFLGALHHATAKLDAELPGMSDVERATAHRSLMRIATVSAHSALENADPAHPYFAPSDPVHYKVGGNSPDAEYYAAPLGHRYRYRIRGDLGSAPFVSFQVYGREGSALRTVSALKDKELVLDDGGRFEIIASADPADSRGPGTWLRLDPTTFTISVRAYYLDRSNETPPNLEIDVLGDPPLENMTDAMMADRIRSMTGLFRFWATAADTWSAEHRKHPNVFAPPQAGDDGEDIGLASHVRYVRGWWKLDPDEALVIEGTAPESRYWIVQITNRFAETFDHRHRTTSLNKSQIALDGEGRYRIVIAHQDPGTGNWLDAAGYREGSMALRFVDLAEVEQPKTRVVPVAELVKE